MRSVSSPIFVHEYRSLASLARGSEAGTGDGRGKSRLAQQLRAVREPARDLGARVALKLKHVVVVAVLDDAESSVHAEVFDEPRVARDGQRRRRGRAEQEAFGLAVREFHVGADVGDGGEIHRHPAVEEWAVEPLEILGRGERIGVVVPDDYVVHRLFLRAMISR